MYERVIERNSSTMEHVTDKYITQGCVKKLMRKHCGHCTMFLVGIVTERYVEELLKSGHLHCVVILSST